MSTREALFLTRGVQFGREGAASTVRYSSGDVLYLASTTSLGSVSVVLPDAAHSAGQKHIVKNCGTPGSVVITAAGGLIDSSPTLSAATAFFSVTLVSDGANWWRIAGVP